MRLIVSLRIIVPERNETPSITASAVSAKRSLWAKRPFSVSLNTGYSPKFLSRSSTRSAVGSSISSTILPSARNTTRSA